jgi:hypothetical protein
MSSVLIKLLGQVLCAKHLTAFLQQFSEVVLFIPDSVMRKPTSKRPWN